MDSDVIAIRRGVDRTHLFLADSGRRDSATYPSPAEYAVTFNAPFRDVVGFEVLEVNVPRTDYIVDSTENTLTYSLDVPRTIAGWKSEVVGNLRTATFVPGDYNLPQLIAHMNDVLANVAKTAGDSTSLAVVPTTSPPEVSNKIRLESGAPFCVLGDSSGIRRTLGFGDPVTAGGMDFGGFGYATVPGWTRDYPNGASGVFVARQTGVLTTDGGSTFPALAGPIPGGLGDYEPVVGRTLRQYFAASADGTPVAVEVYLAIVGSPTESQKTVGVRLARASDHLVLATGTAVATGDDMAPVACALDISSQMVTGTSYYVEVSDASGGAATPDACAAVWYATRNLPTATDTYLTVDGAQTHPDADFCLDVVAGAVGWSLTSPGVVSLVGAKYLKIRCLELEQHLDRDRVGEPTNVGVGMVSLVGYGFMNQRYNFVHFPPMRFAPLGRVQKLTFRLERPDGSLYDAQGVDNNLLCAITYKVPPPPDDAKATFPGAPGYVPDALELQRRRWKAEADALARQRRTAIDAAGRGRGERLAPTFPKRHRPSGAGQ